MKQPFVFIGAFVLIIFGAIWYLLANKPVVQQPVAPPLSQQSSTKSSNPDSPADTTSLSTSGQYVEYTPTTISHTSGTKILFFHAPWCPQCRALEASIKASTIPANVTIIKVDYDSHQALRQQYGVTIQTTLVRVDDAGNLIEKLVAYDEPNFQSVEQLLN